MPLDGGTQLHLAIEKTKIVIFVRKSVPIIKEVQVTVEAVVTKEAVKYLDFRLDTKLTFLQEIKSASEKAEGFTSTLSRLITCVRGPK